MCSHDQILICNITWFSYVALSDSEILITHYLIYNNVDRCILEAGGNLWPRNAWAGGQQHTWYYLWWFKASSVWLPGLQATPSHSSLTVTKPLGLLVKDQNGKADITLPTTHNHDSWSFLPKEMSDLLWLNRTLNGQPIPMLLDSGATVCCLAKRCFNRSPCLQNVLLQPYLGPGLLDANRQITKPCGTIISPLVVGN